MNCRRRDVLRSVGFCLAGGATSVLLSARPGAAARAETPGGDLSGAFNVRDFGATGDGRTIDTPAVNAAIEAASTAGGGTVHFPAGTYACYSIHLRSNVRLHLASGATILAADTPIEGTKSGGYDAAEPNPWDAYQDFGHSHWHNSLIWGEDLHDVGIVGSGLIWGKGLSRMHPSDTELPIATRPGVGNKAIALKNCRNVLFRDFSILAGGHFGILATGVDNMTIDNLTIDTNRDGMDIDCCRGVRVSNCTVNSPWDDGICPKSSFALGFARVTENITVTNCLVTGDYQVGSVIDGSYKRLPPEAALNFTGRIGRFKCGTESNGGFRNITVSNCVFESCWGMALETVDGGLLEDVTFTGISMRDVRNSPLFLRIAGRMRGPKDLPVNTVLRRVLIDNVVCSGPNNVMPVIISGMAGRPVEDVKISNMHMTCRGGGTGEMNGWMPPDKDKEYPEPYRFGPLPAYGFYLRHVADIELNNIGIEALSADGRAAIWMDDVDGADLSRVNLTGKRGGPSFILNNVADFRASGSRGFADVTLLHVKRREI